MAENKGVKWDTTNIVSPWRPDRVTMRRNNERTLQPSTCDTCDRVIAPRMIPFFTFICHLHVCCARCWSSISKELVDDACPHCIQITHKRSFIRSDIFDMSLMGQMEGDQGSSNTADTTEITREGDGNQPSGETYTSVSGSDDNSYLLEVPTYVSLLSSSQNKRGKEKMKNKPNITVGGPPTLPDRPDDLPQVPQPAQGIRDNGKTEKRSKSVKSIAPFVHLHSAPECPNTPRQLGVGRQGGASWTTTAEDVIAIGGVDTPTITLLGPGGVRSVHTLTQGSGVHSGVCLDSETTIVHVEAPIHILVIKLDPATKTNTTITLTTTIPLPVDNPTYVFPLKAEKFGILCDKPCRVEIYHKLKKSKIINLSYNKPSKLDSACVTPEGNICIANHTLGCVFVFQPSGKLLRTHGRGAPFWQVGPGLLWKPMSVHCCKNGTVIVSCHDGRVHAVRGEKWWIVKEEQKGFLIHSAWTAGYVWIVLGSNDNVYVYPIKT